MWKTVKYTITTLLSHLTATKSILSRSRPRIRKQTYLARESFFTVKTFCANKIN